MIEIRSLERLSRRAAGWAAILCASLLGETALADDASLWSVGIGASTTSQVVGFGACGASWSQMRTASPTASLRRSLGAVTFAEASVAGDVGRWHGNFWGQLASCGGGATMNPVLRNGFGTVSLGVRQPVFTRGSGPDLLVEVAGGPLLGLRSGYGNPWEPTGVANSAGTVVADRETAMRLYPGLTVRLGPTVAWSKVGVSVGARASVQPKAAWWQGDVEGSGGWFGPGHQLDLYAMIVTKPGFGAARQRVPRPGGAAAER